MDFFHKIVLGFWIAAFAIGFAIFLLFPDLFRPENLQDLFLKYNIYALSIYFFLAVFRTFFLFPLSAFIFAGLLVFQPWVVFLAGVITVFFSAILPYFFSEFFELDLFLEKKYPKQINKIRSGMNKYGTLIIFVWGLVPITPTNVICYVAGTLRMNFQKFIIAVTLGESILVAIYVWGGDKILKLIFNN